MRSVSNIRKFEGRVTGNRLAKWIDEYFQKMEIDARVVSVKPTKYSADNYERGAAKITILFRVHSDDLYDGSFNCFFSMKELEAYLNQGYRLVLVPDHYGVLTNFELSVSKI